MFQLLEDMVQMKPYFLQAFEESMQYTKIKQNTSNSIEHFLGIFMIIERAVSNSQSIRSSWLLKLISYLNIAKCSSTLKDIIEEIKADPPTTQPNGNIHHITTEVIT